MWHILQDVIVHQWHLVPQIVLCITWNVLEHVLTRRIFTRYLSILEFFYCFRLFWWFLHSIWRDSNDVISGSFLTFYFSSFCPRNIKEEFQRHPDDVSLRPLVASDLRPPWLRNWTVSEPENYFYEWTVENRLSTAEDLLSIVTAAEILIGETSFDISNNVMWQFSIEKIQRRSISGRNIKNITSNLVALIQLYFNLQRKSFRHEF